MSDSDPAPRPGPFDDHTWPEKLTARVVTPGARPRLRGYDIEGDLAPHYPWPASLLLSLVGELPDDETARLFDVTLHFLGAISVAEAPSHAAVLARICDASTAAMSGIAMLALGEQARFVVAQYQPWLAWLRSPVAEIPEVARAQDADERRAIDRLRAAVSPTGIAVVGLERDIDRSAALLACLFRCGLTRDEPMEVAIALARFPLVMAEALATPPRTFKDYPVTLPQIRYEESPR
jgi:hypothetical protein